MCKKAIIAGAALLLIGAVVFGGRLIPYAQTAYDSVTEAVNDSVPIEFQIKAAKKQLEKINPEIKDMVYQIAKEKAEIKGLERQIAQADKSLQKQKNEMMTLKSHLESGDEVYVTTGGQAFTNSRVEEDLRHRFTVFQTAEQTREKSAQILDLRQQALATALTKLDDAKALQRELEVQIENLVARERMVDVAKAASSINIDDSQLARTQNLINDINARLDAEEEFLNMAPQYVGSIPVSEEVSETGDILEEMDKYFTDKSDDTGLVSSSK